MFQPYHPQCPCFQGTRVFLFVFVNHCTGFHLYIDASNCLQDFLADGWGQKMTGHLLGRESCFFLGFSVPKITANTAPCTRCKGMTHRKSQVKYTLFSVWPCRFAIHFFDHFIRSGLIICHEYCIGHHEALKLWSWARRVNGACKLELRNNWNNLDNDYAEFQTWKYLKPFLNTYTVIYLRIHVPRHALYNYTCTQCTHTHAYYCIWSVSDGRDVYIACLKLAKSIRPMSKKLPSDTRLGTFWERSRMCQRIEPLM